MSKQYNTQLSRVEEEGYPRANREREVNDSSQYRSTYISPPLLYDILARKRRDKATVHD